MAHPEQMTLDDESRLCLFPIRYPIFDELYEAQVERFWTHHEIDHGTDKASWDQMSKDEQHYISKILAFFANSDNAVMRNITTRYANEVTWPEFQMCLSVQNFMEGIHVKSYNQMITTVIADPDERLKLFQAVKNDRIIAKKINWITKWAADPDVPLVQCFTAQCMGEGIGFSPSFASMLWLRNENRCPGICFANEKILEDESMHVRFFGQAKQACVNKLPRATIEAMCREIVDIECEFVDDALPYDLPNMNKTLMKEYVHVVANIVLQQMGEEPLYPKAVNPFPFMEKVGLFAKANFFEKRVGEYVKTRKENDIKNETFANLGELDD
jgi:ribonucleotide reductase beta subunit family protein with ferritin-like domain